MKKIDENLFNYKVIYADGALIALGLCSNLPEFAKELIGEPISLESIKALTAEIDSRLGKNIQATFRLGQMDLRESAADMLEDAAKQAEDGIVASAYLQAVALVRDMEIP